MPRPPADILRSVGRAVAKMVRVTTWGFVIAVWASLIFSYLLPQNYRDQSPAYVHLAWASLMVRVVQFHLGLLLLPIVLVTPFLRARRLLIGAVLPAAFILLPVVPQLVRRDVPEQLSRTTRFRLMTANVMFMNDWFEGLLDQVDKRDPDVLQIQEMGTDWAKAIDRMIGDRYPHRAVVPNNDGSGMGVYSKFPIVGEPNNQVAPGTSRRPGQRVVLEVPGGRHIALYNVHLRSPRNADCVVDGRVGFADLHDALAAEQLPFVVAGDFNFPDTAPQHYALLSLGLKEAHAQVGRGRGATWPCRGDVLTRLPGIRIDHAYFSESFQALSCERGKWTSSDHLPVIVDLAVK